MPQWEGTGDLTTNNLPNSGSRGTQSYRPIASTAYLPGTVLQLVAIDKQIYPDFLTVQPLPTGTTLQKIAGVVAHSWGGFSPSDGTSYTSGATGVRGTQFIEAVVKGVARVFVDQAGAGAVTITDGIPLVSSRNTAGYGQGVAVGSAVGGLGTIGVASLPSTGIGSSITAAALAQASQYATIATPAAGDVVNLTIQGPYNTIAPGVAQTVTWSYTLTTADAVSVTTAALGFLTYLNKQPNYSLYFTATQSAGQVITTVNTASAEFLVTFGSGTTTTGQFTINISGMVANSLTFASSVTGAGGTTFTANAATLAAGTGYLGKVPAYITGEF